MPRQLIAQIVTYWPNGFGIIRRMGQRTIPSYILVAPQRGRTFRSSAEIELLMHRNGAMRDYHQRQVAISK
jgi:hypothetical protein